MGVVSKDNALVEEQGALSLGAAKRKARTDGAIGKDNAVAGHDAGMGVAVQGKSYIARLARFSHQPGNLTIGGNHSTGYLLHGVIHALKKAIRTHDALLTKRPASPL